MAKRYTGEDIDKLEQDNLFLQGENAIQKAQIEILQSRIAELQAVGMEVLGQYEDCAVGLIRECSGSIMEDEEKLAAEIADYRRKIEGVE